MLWLAERSSPLSFNLSGVQPAARQDKESDLGAVVWAGTRAAVLPAPLRRKDVLLCRRWDDVVAQCPVRGRVPLRTLWRKSNPGVFLYAAFFTFYILDYFIFERVQLYTYDLIHENLGFKLFWGGLVVYGWLFILPLWGMAAHPDPGFSPPWTYVWLIGTAALFLFGWSISRGANLQKYTFKRWPDRKFLGLIEPNPHIA